MVSIGQWAFRHVLKTQSEKLMLNVEADVPHRSLEVEAHKFLAFNSAA